MGSRVMLRHLVMLSAHGSIYSDVEVYEFKNKTRIVIASQIHKRENGSLNFNSLVNQVMWQTRCGLATYIVCYDA